MWGLEFLNAKNSLICGNATFKCSYAQGCERKFKLDMQPDKWTLEEYEWNTARWVTITYGRREMVMPVVESVLPKKADFDKDWNWRDFFTALTFFDKGVEAGKSKAYSDTDD